MQYRRIADCLPRQRRQREHDRIGTFAPALCSMWLKHGRKWRGLPKHFGNWHTIYTRMNPQEQGRRCWTRVFTA